MVTRRAVLMGQYGFPSASVCLLGGLEEDVEVVVLGFARLLGHVEDVAGGGEVEERATKLSDLS